jgi:hypothetical protein
MEATFLTVDGVDVRSWTDVPASGGRPAIRWPKDGSLVCFICDPDTRFLHWMKRRRVVDGVPSKPNLLVQFEPLRAGHRYQFFMLEMPANSHAPGVSRGLVEKPAYGTAGCLGRGPCMKWFRSPWLANTYGNHLPHGYVVRQAVWFSCGCGDDSSLETDDGDGDGDDDGFNSDHAHADTDADPDPDADPDADTDADAPAMAADPQVPPTPIEAPASVPTAAPSTELDDVYPNAADADADADADMEP